MKTLILITGNIYKAAEFQKLIETPQIRLFHQKIDLIEEQGLDLALLSLKKARQAHQIFQSHPIKKNTYVLIDDTGLELENLNGLPGPLVKWFLERLGPSGLVKLAPEGENKATASCALSLVDLQSKKEWQFIGKTEGFIVPPQGAKGFGWDSIFLPVGSSRSYAEMGTEEKNKISHRGKATRQLQKFLHSLP